MSRVEYTKDDVRRMARYFKDGSALTNAYERRAESERNERTRQELVSNYHTILDVIVSEIVKQTIKLAVAAQPCTAETVQGVMNYREWSPLWLTILQYRGVREQLHHIDSDGCVFTTRVHQQRIRDCCHMSTTSQMLRMVLVCEPDHRQTANQIAAFVADALLNVSSDNIIDERVCQRRDHAVRIVRRVISRERFRSHTRMRSSIW